MPKFKVKTRDNLADRLLFRIAYIFKKHPKVINLNDCEMEKKSILIGNHHGANGPVTYRMFVKHRFMTWGAHNMCEGFKNRRHYLYHVFYRQKKGYGKVRAFIMSVLFGAISRWVYNYAGIIPIYYDMRSKNTYRYSFMCLEKDVSVFIFPEDSTNGYREKLESFVSGFLLLSKLYYGKYKVDLPIYSLYFSSKYNKIIIGKPMYYNELKKNHTDGEILEIFRNNVNALYEEYILDAK